MGVLASLTELSQDSLDWGALVWTTSVAALLITAGVKLLRMDRQRADRVEALFRRMYVEAGSGTRDPSDFVPGIQELQSQGEYERARLVGEAVATQRVLAEDLATSADTGASGAGLAHATDDEGSGALAAARDRLFSGQDRIWDSVAARRDASPPAEGGSGALAAALDRFSGQDRFWDLVAALRDASPPAEGGSGALAAARDRFSGQDRFWDLVAARRIASRHPALQWISPGMEERLWSTTRTPSHPLYFPLSQERAGGFPYWESRAHGLLVSYPHTFVVCNLEQDRSVVESDPWERARISRLLGDPQFLVILVDAVGLLTTDYRYPRR